MRKGITSSVFILLFTIVSGSVFAGDKSACNEFKKSEYKGAYGLCVAYQNADEAGRADILSNWEKRFGTGPDAPTIPGTPPVTPTTPDAPDFSCPCWTDFSFQEICDLGVPDGFVEYAGTSVVAGQALFPDFENFQYSGFQANVEDYDLPTPSPSKCVYRLMSFTSSTPLDDLTIESLTDDELFSCLAEIESIAQNTICE